MSIINYLYKLEDKYDIERDALVWGLVGGLVLGLVWGLVWGLVGGLVLGLVWGLVLGLVGGLVWGLVGGLVLGLVGGLVLGLVWGLGSLISVSLIVSIKYFPLQTFYICLAIVLIIAIAELIFLVFDKKKPKPKENKFWFTAGRKAIAYLESIFIVLEANGLCQLSVRGFPYIKKYFPEILKWIGYIGLALLVLAVIGLILYGYIKLNSLKYGGKK